MFCAGGTPGASACKGDSGGGLFFKISNTWYIRGIVTFIPTLDVNGEDQCDNSKYVVFTDVAEFRTWLSQFISLEAFVDNTVNKDTICNAANRFDHRYLFVGHESGISRVTMNGVQISTVISNSGVRGLDCDCVEGRIYWINLADKQILSTNYDGSDQSHFIASANLPADLTVDWISRRLFWVDVKEKTVENRMFQSRWNRSPNTDRLELEIHTTNRLTQPLESSATSMW
ncbi:hypothetical protein ZHAS_00016310 [Anopheles sinensis]|uniref:Peptidase S1 domain-containing protein n=1 Tax=Anopheles sinensis TaxID=74873 RepID=A0A084WDN3_ANOSI|nr:hypothetical protein ZHAS_00016310 [Anopheles sinensis]